MNCRFAKLFRFFPDSWRGRGIRDIQRILPGSNKFVEFIRRQLGKMPLVTLIVVIIHIVINDDLNLSKLSTFRKFRQDVILHMTEEAFLRSVVPAVSSAGHGLAEFFIIKDIYELVAGIVAALIGMNDRFRLEGDSMIFHQFVDGFQDEIHFQLWTEHVRQYLLSKGI